MRQRMVAGNWKLNGSKELTRSLLAGITTGLHDDVSADVVVCPPFVYLEQAAAALADSCVKLGAQNVCAETSGAFTGEISADMLREVGCQYVIVGHSERRSLYAESDNLVARKFVAARDSGLTPILCVGETLNERERGVTEQVIARQLQEVISLAGAETVASAVIAYEPVWAIGSGLTATPDQAQAVHAFMRERLRDSGAKADACCMLYGGSVKPSNAAELFSMPDIDGGLIGGASLVVGDFLAICRAA
ncbi:triose-phosphate isomerase [Acidihalobacter ferrooxydans]|uniref:Triosephosphate isomerase n=1 Tax=Acidihalobacter ferrooxydans TaxID=1765967 RepID=A0A1P8UJ71_9GAMM|nr:triose-phosphate isomerase [Acidihalobacter ferrooxydans]APZ43867.1 triose-phosphate isomerase [Acidihalobacter ferrooxydans]